MSAPGHNRAEGRIRSFFERWQCIEADKQAIADDLKELFAEAKGEGWDTKAMRAVFRDKAKMESENAGDSAKRQEFEAICDLYRSALDGDPRAHPARVASDVPDHDAETGEITESDTPNARPEPAAKSADHIETPAPESVSAQEPAESTGSGGMHDEETFHPPTNSAPVAQRKDQEDSNPSVAGSNPAGRSNSDHDDFDLIRDMPEFLRRTDGYPKSGEIA